MTELAQQISWAIAARNTTNFFECRQQSKLLLQGSRSVRDPSVLDHLRSIFSSDLQNSGMASSTVLSDYKKYMHEWIHSHPTSLITGLDNYRISFSSGTTQSFDSFYLRHRDKRMRCYVGEYFYHLKTWLSNQINWSFITLADPLVSGDALVLSVPFCDDGNLMPSIKNILTECDELGIPVLIDCCYFPISSNVSFDASHSCIDTVAFSLSKAFPIANLRIGVRYTKDHIQDGQTLHDSINYNNSLSAYIGLQLIEKFTPDYIYNTYHSRQQQVCDTFGLTASQSVLFALGDHTWDMYNRNNLLKVYNLELDPSAFKNRICLVSIYDNWDIYDEITNRI